TEVIAVVTARSSVFRWIVCVRSVIPDSLAGSGCSGDGAESGTRAALCTPVCSAHGCVPGPPQTTFWPLPPSMLFHGINGASAAEAEALPPEPGQQRDNLRS